MSASLFLLQEWIDQQKLLCFRFFPIISADNEKVGELQVALVLESLMGMLVNCLTLFPVVTTSPFVFRAFRGHQSSHLLVSICSLVRQPILNPDAGHEFGFLLGRRGGTAHQPAARCARRPAALPPRVFRRSVRFSAGQGEAEIGVVDRLSVGSRCNLLCVCGFLYWADWWYILFTARSLLVDLRLRVSMKFSSMERGTRKILLCAAPRSRYFGVHRFGQTNDGRIGVPFCCT